MTAMTEAPYSFTIKVGPQGNLLTVRADNYDDFAARLQELQSLAAIITGEGTHEQAVATAQAALGATVIAEQATAPAPAPSAPAAAGSPEVVTDKYGAQYTYGLAEAPALPDGRGYYVKKAWTSQKGKRLVAWVDPVKGPKPFAKGAAEAELIWI